MPVSLGGVQEDEWEPEPELEAASNVSTERNLSGLDSSSLQTGKASVKIAQLRPTRTSYHKCSSDTNPKFTSIGKALDSMGLIKVFGDWEFFLSWR